MKAYSSASGGVIFVPDEIERAPKTISYSEFLEQQNAEERVGVFGRQKASTQPKKSAKQAA